MSRALEEAKPSEFFLVLRACGALKVIMPELDILFGVPQPPQHHPEVDTGDHVMLCIDIARKQFNTLIVTWATLVHDLGKGVTPKEEWPRHIRHEINGVPLVQAVSDRFKVPRDFCDLGKLTSEHHLRCHRLLEMRSKSVLRLLESLDAFRRPERLVYFTQACESDARGRLGLENRPYPQRNILINCGKAGKNVDIKPLLEKDYKGLKLAEQIRRLRIKAIAEYLEEAQEEAQEEVQKKGQETNNEQ